MRIADPQGQWLSDGEHERGVSLQIGVKWLERGRKD